MPAASKAKHGSHVRARRPQHARTHAVERERARFGRYHVRFDSRTAEAADRDGEGHVVVVILDGQTDGLFSAAQRIQRREGGRHGMRMIDTGVLGCWAPRVAVCAHGHGEGTKYVSLPTASVLYA